MTSLSWQNCLLTSLYWQHCLGIVIRIQMIQTFKFCTVFTCEWSKPSKRLIIFPRIYSKSLFFRDISFIWELLFMNIILFFQPLRLTWRQVSYLARRDEQQGGRLARKWQEDSRDSVCPADCIIPHSPSPPTGLSLITSSLNPSLASSDLDKWEH